MAKALFEELVNQIERKIGKCQIISLPCCVHLYGEFDFLAALPKKDRLEIRLGLNRKLDSPRLKAGVSMSAKVYKNCIDVSQKEEIDGVLIGWIREAYYLHDVKYN